MFEFVNVTYKHILDISAMTIPSRRITTLIGPSGTGKTTVLRLLNKLISPTQGEIFFEKQPLSRLESVAHRRQVTLLSQNPPMFEGSIRENLVKGLVFQDRPMPSDQTLQDMLERLELSMSLDSSSQTLSGGEKQRLALGRVLLLDSPVYLLDEPSSALDVRTEELMIQRLTDFARDRQKTVVMVTHSTIMAHKYSDHIIEMGKDSSSGVGIILAS